MIKTEKLKKSLSSLLIWHDKNGLEGYDPYDIKCRNNFSRFLYHKHLGLGIVGKALSYIIFEILDIRFPKTLRSLLFVKKKLYPTALSHYIQSLLLSSPDFPDNKEKAVKLLDKLWEIKIQDIDHPSWGLPFIWGYGNRRFNQKTSLTVVNVWVGDAFLIAYQTLKSDQYLEKAKAIGETIVNCTGYQELDNGDICFNYSNKSKDFINNANLLAAAFLAKLDQLNNSNNYKDLVIRAMNFSISTALEDGSLPYQITASSVSTKNDLYHCGYEIRSLSEIAKIYQKPDILEFAKTYWKVVREKHLSFSPFFYYRAERKKIIADTTSLAELLLIRKELQLKDEELDDLLEFFIQRHQMKDGSFIYQERANGVLSKISFIRWTQGWMSMALAKNIYQ